MQMAGQTSVVVSSGAKGESRAAPLERAVWQSCHCDRSTVQLVTTPRNGDDAMTDAPLVALLVRRLEVADYTPTRTPMAGSVAENKGTVNFIST